MGSFCLKSLGQATKNADRCNAVKGHSIAQSPKHAQNANQGAIHVAASAHRMNKTFSTQPESTCYE